MRVRTIVSLVQQVEVQAALTMAILLTRELWKAEDKLEFLLGQKIDRADEVIRELALEDPECGTAEDKLNYFLEEALPRKNKRKHNNR
jgi:hypothetical protein